MLEHVRISEGSDSRTLAKAFGTDYLLLDPRSESDRGPSGKLRAAAERADIPALTVELSNSRTVSQASVETGVEGIENVLRELELIEMPPVGMLDQTVLRDNAKNAKTDESGVFEPSPRVSIGNRLEDGQTLGTVYNPRSFEHLETITLNESGVPYSLLRGGIVVEGERVAGIATRC